MHTLHVIDAKSSHHSVREYKHVEQCDHEEHNDANRSKRLGLRQRRQLWQLLLRVGSKVARARKLQRVSKPRTASVNTTGVVISNSSCRTANIMLRRVDYGCTAALHAACKHAASRLEHRRDTECACAC